MITVFIRIQCGVLKADKSCYIKCISCRRAVDCKCRQMHDGSLVSIVYDYVLVFIPDIPKRGNISSGYAFSLIGISPPQGSPAGALLCCDGFISLGVGLDASIMIASACHRPARRRRTAARLIDRAELVRRSPACSAHRLPDSRRKVKDMLIFSFQGSEE